MVSITHIYALVCPNTDHVRYIGKSNNPQKRLHSHLTDGRMNHRRNWLLSLKKENKLPKVEILDTVKIEEWAFWEQHYISLYRSFGFNLLNRTCGGEGHDFHDNKTRKSFSGEKNPMFGKKRPEVGEMVRKKLKGKTFDEIYGKQKADIIRKKISDGGKKPRNFSKEVREKLSIQMKKMVKLESTKLAMSKNSFFKGKKGHLSPYAKPVLQYDLDGNFIKEWGSMIDAEKSVGGGIKTSISRGNGKGVSRGFKWVYK